jgi:hypothetical protein
MSWLAFSIIASIVLTVVLNVVLRLFPDSADRLRDRMYRSVERPGDAWDGERWGDRWDGTPRSGVRVIFPWKAMLIGSLLLTVVLNLWLYLR